MRIKISKKRDTSVERYNLVHTLKGRLDPKLIAKACGVSYITVLRMARAETYNEYTDKLKASYIKTMDKRKKYVVLKPAEPVEVKPEFKETTKDLSEMGNLACNAILNSILMELKNLNETLNKKKFIF